MMSLALRNVKEDVRDAMPVISHSEVGSRLIGILPLVSRESPYHDRCRSHSLTASRMLWTRICTRVCRRMTMGRYRNRSVCQKESRIESH